MVAEWTQAEDRGEIGCGVEDDERHHPPVPVLEGREREADASRDDDVTRDVDGVAPRGGEG